MCNRCGRTGRFGFVLVDRYADGIEDWRCKIDDIPAGAMDVEATQRRNQVVDELLR